MSKRTWMGRLAVGQELIDKSVVDKAEQTAAKSGKPVGEELVEWGADQATVDALRRAMTELIGSDAPLDDADLEIQRKNARLQGRILVNWELCSPVQVREGIEKTLGDVGEGLERTLGPAMVELGYLTPHQQYKLQTQQKSRMVCPADGSSYDVLGYMEGLRLKCPQCKGFLEVAEDQEASSGKAQQLVYDKGQAEDLALVGRLVLKNKLVTKEQLSKAVKLQARSKPGTTIIEVLKREKLLSWSQGRAIDKEKKRLLKAKQQQSIDAFESTNIGAIGLQMGYFDENALQLMLDEQKKLAQDGERRRLGELMIEGGFLTSYQLMKLLSLQSKQLVVCPDCGTQLNVQGLPDDAAPKCPECQAEMEVPEKVDTVEALQTMSFDLSSMVAMAPKREMREAVPGEMKRGATRIIKEALEDTRAPGAPSKTAAPAAPAKSPIASPKAAGVQVDQLDQTMSLFDYSAGGGTARRRKKLDGTALAEWVKGCMKRNQSWQVVAAPGYWFCPYCGVACRPTKGNKDFYAAALRHLTVECEIFQSIGQPPIFPLPELQRRATYTFAKEQLARDAAWHIRDREGRWVNPYTMEITDVDLSVGRITRQAADAITKALLEIPNWNPAKPPKRKPKEEIIAGVAKAFTLAHMRRKVTQLVQKNPAWRVRNKNGHWVCPYAKKAIDSIKADTPLELTTNAPAKIARYLLEDCAEFRAKQQPAKTAEELHAAIADPPPADAQVTAEAFAQASGTKLITPTQVQLAPDDLDSTLAQAKRDLEQQMDKMSAELDRAAVKARAMLPTLPVLPGFEVFVHFDQLDGVGGDFYDFIKLSEGQVGLSIGDVSGHGVDAAMVMTMAKKTLKMVARQSSSPKNTLVLANEEILQDLDGRTFVTMWYGMLDPSSWTLRFARAGHEPLLLFNPDRTPSVQVMSSDGMTAGITSGARYSKIMTEVELKLQPGDIGLLYTDGISEVMNAASEQFGRERIEAVLRGCSGATAEEAVKAVLGAVDAFKDGEVDDDQTVIAFRYTG